MINDTSSTHLDSQTKNISSTTGVDDISQSNDFPCPNCKQNCEDTDCICCDSCSNWFHDECTHLTKSKLNHHRLNNLSSFKCLFCKAKKNCHTCHEPVKASPSSNSLYCIKCKIVLCQSCANVDDGQISNFNTSDEMFFYCNDCSHVP